MSHPQGPSIQDARGVVSETGVIDAWRIGYDSTMRAAPLRDITRDEIERFDRDGAVLLKSILPEAWVRVLEEGLDDAIAHPTPLSSGVGTDLRTDQFPASHSKGLARIVEESPVAEIVGRCLESSVRFYMDQMFAKRAGPISATPWHQDTCYYNLDGHDLIRAWISPDPIPREASIEIVRGSHHWNVTYRPLAGRDPDHDAEARAQQERASDATPMIGADAHKQWTYFDGVRDMTLPPVPDIEGRRASFDVLGWAYEPGDVLLFHGHILHGAAGGAELPNPRRAHASLWAGDDVRYLHRKGQVVPDPEALYAFEPKSGQPLSDFPSVFPVAWAPEARRG